jgi:hypothetical protein
MRLDYASFLEYKRKGRVELASDLDVQGRG